MECTKENLHFLIETLRRCDYNASEIHRIMEEAWPAECLSVQRIRAISQSFREETRETFKRNPGSGRPKSDVRRNNIDSVRQLIEEDSCLTVRQIAEELELAKTMVHNIISDDLELIWFHTKWVPHTLTDANKVTRVARCEDLLVTYSSRLTQNNLITIDEKYFYCRQLRPRNVVGNWLSEAGDVPIRQTARRSTMENKYLAIVAVSQKGKHYYEVLERNVTVNADLYIGFLTRMERYFRELQNPILPENMRIQQDNATPHTAHRTAAHMEEMNIRWVRQPPYSPDLNLCDRYIFPRLEAVRPKFESADDIRRFLDHEIPNFTQDRMRKALLDNIEHVRKVIDNGGNYVTE